MSKNKNGVPTKPDVNPYDLVSVSNAAKTLSHKVPHDPRRENPYSLSSTRLQQGSLIVPKQR